MERPTKKLSIYLKKKDSREEAKKTVTCKLLRRWEKRAGRIDKKSER